MNTQKTERGQALVLIILSIVGLLGFGALAVDMGQVYSERRRAQSAADAAALAAAYEDINPDSAVDPIVKAEDIAMTNGFTQNGMDVWVEVYNAPIDGPYSVISPNIVPEEYFQVKITRRLKPIFAQFIFAGQQQFTVEAVAHARDIQSISPGSAVHALSSDPEALEIQGNVDALVNGGNVRSNGGAIKRGGSGEITVTDANIYTDLGWVNTSGVSPAPRHSDPVIVAEPPEPDCDIPNGTVTGGSDKTFTPGRYPSGISINGGNNVMKRGMYCIVGDIDIRGNATVKGDGIFIVMLTGEIRTNGNSEIKWKRSNNLVDNSGNQWGGMLIYAPRPNTNQVYLTGTNGTIFQGTVFAPAGHCELGGNNITVGLNTSIICDTILLHGNPHMTITYVEKQNFRNAPMVELTQ